MVASMAQAFFPITDSRREVFCRTKWYALSLKSGSMSKPLHSRLALQPAPVFRPPCGPTQEPKLTVGLERLDFLKTLNKLELQFRYVNAPRVESGIGNNKGRGDFLAKNLLLKQLDDKPAINSEHSPIYVTSGLRR